MASIPPNLLVDVVGRSDDDVVDRLGDDRFVSLPAIELDVSAATAAGVTEAYAAALDDGERLIEDAVGTAPTRALHIVDEPLSGAGAQFLRDLGVGYLVMTPERYDSTFGTELPDTDRFVRVVLPDDGNVPLLVVDPIGEDFAPARADELLADATPTEWAVRTVATAVLEHRRAGQTIRRSRLIALDSYAAPDPRLVNAFAEMAATTPDLDVVDATEFVDATDVQRAPGGRTLVLPERAGPDLTERLETIDATRLLLASTGSMLVDDGDARALEWNTQLDGLISTGVLDREAASTIAQLAQEADSIRTSVVPPDPFTFTLTGRSDDITIRVGNRGTEPLDVVVHLESPKLTFPTNDLRVRLRPNDTTDVRMTVDARSNGTSPVSVEIRTPLGDTLAEPVTLTSRVNALTGLGQVLTGAFVLVLGTWWFTNWRQRRRDEVVATTAG